MKGGVKMNVIPENMKVTLRVAREINGYTQAEAAEKLGISTDTLRSYERGKVTRIFLF